MHTTLLLLLPVLLLSACRQHDSPSPLKFKAYDHNPIVVPGKPGSWDDLGLLIPSAIKHDNVFYLFYTGVNIQGIPAIGFATSTDGYHFTKYKGNPILPPDQTGFDAFGTAAPAIIIEDTVWVMYYNALAMPGYGPGPFIGRATASAPACPWYRSETPVLTTGSRGEWDCGFIPTFSILKLKNGGYMMFYSAGKEYVTGEDCFIGLATSMDGTTWKKHNDPATTQHPFEESDPVFMPGDKADWDGMEVFVSNVQMSSKGFEMYYSGRAIKDKVETMDFGYAISKDGIHWEKYKGNPYYTLENDPYAMSLRENERLIELPSFIFSDTICFMYYDYGAVVGKIGLATARVH